MLHRMKRRNARENSLPSSSTPYTSLTVPEMKMRLNNLHQSLRSSQNKVKMLESKLKRELHNRSISINDKELNEDLVNIMKEESSRKIMLEAGSFKRVFWEQQEKALSLNCIKSMRWDPLMIRFCLYLRHLSSSAYSLLKESGVLTLPSERTLRDYTYYFKASSGFSGKLMYYYFCCIIIFIPR